MRAIADAIRLLEDDAHRLAVTSMAPEAPDAAPPPALAHRVEAVRKGLGPIRDADLLAQSLAREAGLAQALASEPSALRLGYAIRYVELTTGAKVPSWTQRL